MKRMKKAKSVFIIVDATDFNFNNLKHCKDLGVISVRKGGSTSSGLRLYSALAFDENFNPLGVIYAKLVSPQLRTEEERKNAKNIPQEDKETQIWIDIYHHIEDIKSVYPDTKFTYIADRGADFYNFWLAYDAKKLVNLTIRAKHDRSLIDNNKLFSSVKKKKLWQRILSMCQN